ncbi:hypothetical protein NDU88_002811 [Pleurodeles waltl]|uniref:Uncharacterized protein n=1 Tax=Pleurodeles waltl TaxID=8319 RepID=A0AAV7W542_PLEWA|nr:hypothetical protein NDU88_002811 [Pleurodeles waltl]
MMIVSRTSRTKSNEDYWFLPLGFLELHLRPPWCRPLPAPRPPAAPAAPAASPAPPPRTRRPPPRPPLRRLPSTPARSSGACADGELSLRGSDLPVGRLGGTGRCSVDDEGPPPRRSVRGPNNPPRIARDRGKPIHRGNGVLRRETLAAKRPHSAELPLLERGVAMRESPGVLTVLMIVPLS